MIVRPIASSSKGNAYVVEQDGEALLIDCGISCRCLRKAVDPAIVKAVLVTHNHTDHVGGLRVLLEHYDIPVYANAMTAEATAAQEKLDDSAFVCFENGQEFEIGPFRVSPFSVPHDAADPVGYLVRTDLTYFHGTDIGTPLDSIGVKLHEADIATLESNHDLSLLNCSARPECLKQRIRGERGHLSNDQAAALVRRFASPRLRRLFLAHLSHECNAPHIAERTMRETLTAMGRTDIALEVIGG